MFKQISFFLFFSLICKLAVAEQYTIHDLGIDAENVDISRAVFINSWGEVGGEFRNDDKIYVFLWSEDLGMQILGQFESHDRNLLGEMIPKMPLIMKGNDLSQFLFGFGPYPVQHLNYSWDKLEGLKTNNGEYRAIDLNNDGARLMYNGTHVIFESSEGKKIKIKKIKNLIFTAMNDLDRVVLVGYGQVVKHFTPTNQTSYPFSIIHVHNFSTLQIPENDWKFTECEYNGIQQLKTIINTDEILYTSVDFHSSFLSTGEKIASFEGNDMNLSGYVVGHRNHDAAIWFPSLGCVEILLPLVINPGEWEKLTVAYKINHGGKIVGEGIKNGKTQAFVLTPLDYYRKKGAST